jgi:GNAT superfamily N-acetyltransferase
MTGDVTFRWIDGPVASQEDWDRIESILATRGWMSLARETSRILVAEHDGELKGFVVLQLVPHTEPLWVAPDARGTGLAESLADQMMEFLVSIHARGWMVVADNPFAARLCEDRKYKRVEAPVYVRVEP